MNDKDKKKTHDEHNLWLLPQPMLLTVDHGWLHQTPKKRPMTRLERCPGPDHAVLDCLLGFRNLSPRILHYRPASDAELAAYAHYLGDPSIKPDTAHRPGTTYDFMFLRGSACLANAHLALSEAAGCHVRVWLDTASDLNPEAVESALVASHAIAASRVHATGIEYELSPLT